MTEVTTEEVFGPEVKEPKEKEREVPESKAAEPVKEPEPSEPEEKPEPDNEPEDAPEQQETGDTPPPPGDNAPPKGFVPLAAVEDERRKRQEFEKQVKDYQKRMAELEQSNQRVPLEYSKDPEGYVRSQVQNAVVNLSREMVSSVHSDYEEMESYLVERTNLDPILAQQVHVGLVNSTNPAKFAYDTAKRLKREQELEQAGGWEKWQEAERERIRKELEQQFRQPVSQPEAEAPPESLAAAPSTVSQKDTFRAPSSREVFDN